MNQHATDALLQLLDGIASGETDLADGIDDAVSVAQEVLGVDGAAVMLLTADGSMGLAGASNEPAAALERSQIELGDGPGIECTRRGSVIAVDDLDEHPHWHTLAQPGIRAVLAAPIWFAGRRAGNLNAFCRHPHEWTREDGQALAAYAGVITALLRVGLAAQDDDPVVTNLRASLDANP